MAALAKDRSTPEREGVLFRAPVKKGVTIHAGSLVAKAADGYAEPASKAASLVVLGRAEEAAKGGSANGDTTVLVRRGTFKWANDSAAPVTAAEVGEEKAFIVDDQTVTKTASGSTAAGKVIAVESDGVWVETL